MRAVRPLRDQRRSKDLESRYSSDKYHLLDILFYSLITYEQKLESEQHVERQLLLDYVVLFLVELISEIAIFQATRVCL